MPLSADSLISLEEAQAQGLGLEDSLLETLINTASEMAVEYTGPLLYEEDILEFPDLVDRGDSWANLDEFLRLERRPIASVSTVKVDNQEQTVKAVEEATELPITREPETVWTQPKWLKNGKLFRSNGWPVGTVMIKYNAGFGGPNQNPTPPVTVSPLPLPVRQAVLMIIGQISSLIERGMDLSLVSERTAGSWAQRWTDDKGQEFEIFPSAARKLLVRYKRKGLLR